MRLIGFCTRCHHFRYVTVAGPMAHPRAVAYGLCSQCEDETEAERAAARDGARKAARRAELADTGTLIEEDDNVKFKMQDGKVYQGRSYTAVVEHMMDDKLTPARSTDTYRRETAKRVAGLYKIVVDATDDKAFIRSLVAGGVIEEIPRAAPVSRFGDASG